MVRFDEVVSAGVKLGFGAEVGFRGEKYVDFIRLDVVLHFGLTPSQAVCMPYDNLEQYLHSLLFRMATRCVT